MTKKDKILETMLKLIAQNGIQGSPMSLIAKESDVATGTIYHHFKSKEEIVNEIYLNIKREFQKIIQSVDKTKSFKEQFYELWVKMYEYYSNHPLIFSFSQQVSHTPIISEETKLKGLEYYQGIFDFFTEGITKNYFTNGDLEVMVLLTYQNILTLVELKINGKKINKKTIEQAIDFSWNGLTK